jgi:hypothetical protein
MKGSSATVSLMSQTDLDINFAIQLALNYSGVNAHSWIIDQMVRRLSGDAYVNLIQNVRDSGGDGYDYSRWSYGTPPSYPDEGASFEECNMQVMFTWTGNHAEEVQRSAVSIAVKYCTVTERSHKQWVIDQMIRALSGDYYDHLISEHPYGHWNVGVAP